MQQLILDLSARPDTFPEAVFYRESNVGAVGCPENLAESGPIQSYPGQDLFVIWGPTGCGKSFLSQCLASTGFSPLPLADMAPLPLWQLDIGRRSKTRRN